MRARVLVVDDDRSVCLSLRSGLEAHDLDAETHASAESAMKALQARDVDIVVSDIQLPGIDGIELCRWIAAKYPTLPVVVMTAYGSLDGAIAAIRAGAYDFVTKPLEVETLVVAIDRALAHRRLRDEVTELRRAIGHSDGFEELWGASAAMRTVFELVERVAPTDASVLITGESGTGKELIARALHRRSRRASGPFVSVNCAALPEPLLESELFGHVRGAFTDAKTARPGLFVQATGGTLFLDEIGDMPLGLQPKLLRVLQERRVRPVGGDGEVACDARIIAATNADVEAAIERKQFRQDLYFRIGVIHVDLPPLRSRGGDVMLLTQRYLSRFAAETGKRVRSLSPVATERILGYDWPGNVRELQNCIERAVTLARRSEIDLDDLPPRVREHRDPRVFVAADDPAELLPLEEVERRYVLHVLEAVGGIKSIAARVLRLDRKTLYRKLSRYENAAPRPPAAESEQTSAGDTTLARNRR